MRELYTVYLVGDTPTVCGGTNKQLTVRLKKADEAASSKGK